MGLYAPTLAVLLAMLIGAILMPAANAAPLERVKDLATGVDDATRTKIPARIHDTDWRWDGPTRTVYLFAADQDRVPDAFLADAASPRSRWLTNDETPAGPFTFEAHVDLTGFDPATARIEGLRIAADNWVQSVAVNGTTLFEQAPPTETGAEFEMFRELGALGAGTFVAGGNVISVVVVNDPWETETNPAALRVEGEVVAERSATLASSFRELGDLPGGDNFSIALALSADGSTVTGYSGSTLGEKGEAFRWRSETGLQGIGCIEGYCGVSQAGLIVPPISLATGVSADGEVVAGISQFTSVGMGVCFILPQTAVFTWTEEDGFFTHDAGVRHDVAGFAANGSAIAGHSGWGWTTSGCIPTGLIGTWIDRGAGPAPLPEVPPDDFGRPLWNLPLLVSADGATVVGKQVMLPSLPGKFFSWEDGGEVETFDDSFEPLGGSPDLSILVGIAPPHAGGFVWSRELGMRELDAGTDDPAVYPTVVTFDGRAILGGLDPFVSIWLNGGPGISLHAYLEAEHGLDLNGWLLTRVAGISNDGRVIAGTGVNPDGDTMAWIAQLAVPVPEPAAGGIGVAVLGVLAYRRRSRLR